MRRFPCGAAGLFAGVAEIAYENRRAFNIKMGAASGTAQRLSAVRRYAPAVKMGLFPDGNRPQMDPECSCDASLAAKHEIQARLIGKKYISSAGAT